jgi:serine/threonine-protein phosphatase PGAM5
MKLMRRMLVVLFVAAVSVATTAPARAQTPAAKKPSGTHYVILIRHGMYDSDSTVTDDAKGNALNALGHEQARLTGQRLKGLPVKIHALVTSPYLRALETAEDIGAVIGMKPVVDTLLHECTPRFESRPDYTRLASDEEMAACETNLGAAFGRYFAPTPEADTHDVLVCHGNVIRWLVCKAMGIDPHNWRRFTIGNGSITALVVAPDGTLRMAAYSDTGHIPVEKQTWTGKGAGWMVPVSTAAKGMK